MKHRPGRIVMIAANSLQSSIAREAFVFVHGGDMRGMLTTFGSLDDWPSFVESWNHLEVDTYMADGGRYRRRRHAAYGATRGDSVRRKPHQPHIQAPEYNPLHGGIVRWFEPIAQELGDGPTMRTILAFCQSLFGSLAPTTASWHIEAHQFRIEARTGEPGQPTPEGVHRDGVDYVLVLLIDRRNINRGVTDIHALDGRPLGHFTLTDPLDTALVDDRRVAHGVTAVQPIDPALPAYRDVLVVTFAAEPE
jgi:hypothetical protein